MSYYFMTLVIEFAVAGCFISRVEPLPGLSQPPPPSGTPPSKKEESREEMLRMRELTTPDWLSSARGGTASLSPS